MQPTFYILQASVQISLFISPGQGYTDCTNYIQFLGSALGPHPGMREILEFPLDYCRDLGQMVHNYESVAKGLGCVILKGLG